jgi:hypothetical protein
VLDNTTFVQKNEEMMASKKLSFVFVAILCISTLLMFTSHSLGDLKTSQGKIFNGLYANYDFEISGPAEHSSFQYVYDPSGLYNVTWEINNTLPAYWQEDIQTRLISNVSGYGTDFGNGVHTPVWVLTNLTLGDTVLIAVDGIGDYSFNVSDEIEIIYPGFGSLNVWVMQEFINPARIAWYEKSTGLLLNGTFPNFIQDYNLTLTATNMFSHNNGGGGGIPGYSLFAVIPLTIIITLVIIRKQKRKLI